jgi:hypothetical protein
MLGFWIGAPSVEDRISMQIGPGRETRSEPSAVDAEPNLLLMHNSESEERSVQLI